MNQQVLIVLPKIILTVHDGILDFKDNTAILQATKSSRGFLLCGLRSSNTTGWGEKISAILKSVPALRFKYKIEI